MKEFNLSEKIEESINMERKWIDVKDIKEGIKKLKEKNLETVERCILNLISYERMLKELSYRNIDTLVDEELSG